MEVLATKFQGLGCFRTWEIMILVKSCDQWCHATQQGVQGWVQGQKFLHALVVLPTKFGEEQISICWDIYIFLLKLHTLPFVFAPGSLMAAITPKSSIHKELPVTTSFQRMVFSVIFSNVNLLKTAIVRFSSKLHPIFELQIALVAKNSNIKD